MSPDEVLMARAADILGDLYEIRLMEAEASAADLVLSDEAQQLEPGVAEIGSKFERPEGRDDLAHLHMRVRLEMRRDDDGGGGGGGPVFTVGVAYAALYQLRTPSSDEDLHAASILIAGPTLWPYARSLMAELSLQMGIHPAITLPAMTSQDFLKAYHESTIDDPEPGAGDKG